MVFTGLPSSDWFSLLSIFCCCRQIQSNKVLLCFTAVILMFDH